ncbi:hypothetical protein Tco_0379229 [Tanacetum coccineum]
MCTLKQIYPSAFFDIMIHLVIHLPKEAIQGEPVYMRWMYPFERYMKKLKNYVRNKAKAEGPIAEGYVADEALTFCSMYLEDIETRFNRPDRNRDTPIFDVPFTKIASYMTDFSTENPPTQLRSEFLYWFKTKITRLVAADKSRCSDDIITLAHRPEVFANSYTSCTVNDVRNEWCKDDQYILGTHTNKFVYLEDPSNNENWRVVQQAYHRKIWHREEIEPDVIHDQNSCDIALSANLDDITHTRLSRASQSTEVDNIQASVSDDDDFIIDVDEDEDVLVIDSDIDGSESDNNQCEGGYYMALVLRHGRDPGGNDQPPGPSRRPPHGGCQGSGRGKKGRSKTTLIAFRKIWDDNEKKFLPINFDSHDGETWKPAKVEDQFKTNIWPEIQIYIDMAPHLTGPKRKHVKNAIDAICAECYRYHKYRFKRDEFVKKDGYKHPDVLRAKPPKMPIDEWNRHISFFLQPNQMKKSETNLKNRASYHIRVYKEQGQMLHHDTYVKATGTYVNEAAATKHIPQRYVWLLLRWYPNTPSATKGKELQDALKSSQESGENVPEKEVVKKVLGTRSGHTCGVGQKLKGVSSSSSATSSSSRYYGGSKAYTQDEVNGLIEMEGKKLGKILGKKIGKRFASSFNKKLENLLTELAKKGIPLDKTLVVGEEDEEYEESDDEEMEVLDEDEEINDGDDSVE